MKVCRKCGVEKPVSEFHKNKKTKDGYSVYCKLCKSEAGRLLHIKRKNGEVTDGEKAALKREKNLSQELKHCPKCGETKPFVKFFKDKQQKCGLASHCKDCHAKKGKNYLLNNKEKCAATHRKYEIKKAVKIAARKKKYYIQKKDKIAERIKRLNKAPTKSKKLLEQLIVTDGPQFDSQGFVTVDCYFCHKKFRPTRKAVASRISGIKGTTSGEQNLYCSDKCKKSCPTYNFKPHMQVDPRSKLYTPPTESEKARAATKTATIKKALCDKHGALLCDRCGDVGNVELHHTLPVAQYGMESVNQDSYLLLCPGCHVALHRECA